ncbi:carbohydrate ABC transporter permease [Lacrimispora sp.]|uniref:carbohydrate ABC transporter permease n=1 Tax=Lacrimispora sp. TaxID=2719234 RepID=UPI00345FB8DF
MKQQRDTKRFLKKNGFNILLILPLIVFIFSFTIVPIIRTVLISFQDSTTSAWTVDNYKSVITRGIFGEAIFNTLAITVIGLILQMTLGYLIATMLRQTFVGKGLARTLVLLPMGVPTMVSGVAMLYLFSTSGYINEVLYRLSLAPIPIDWTATKLRSLLVIAVADSWKVMPMVVMLFLAGLEAIPTEIYEAANVDGAGIMAKFWHITLPQLKATVTMTVLTRVVDLLRIFELPKVLVGQSTPFLATIAYEEYSYNNHANSAVASTLLLMIILVIVSLYMFFVERERKVKRP